MNKYVGFLVGVIILFFVVGCTGRFPPLEEPESFESPGASESAAQTELQPNATISGEEEMVFDWSEDACEKTTMPDLPVRPFRNADGLINLNISSEYNFRLVGTDFDALEMDCNPTLVSGLDPDPSEFDFYEWIGATYTLDGETIFATIHNEYYGDIGAMADSQRDFDKEQGADNWSYAAWNGSRYMDLSFDTINNRWQGAHTLCQITDWGAHPAPGCDPSRIWTSQMNANVTVFGHIQDLSTAGGDGVAVSIFKDNEPLWSLTLDGTDGNIHKFNIEVDVVVGTQLQFQVNQRENADNDATAFVVKIDEGTDPCPSGERNNCLMASLTYAVSTDGGKTFNQPDAPSHYIASAPTRYQPDWGISNIWQPSNIVYNPDDGFFYQVINRIYAPLGQGGHINSICVMRTKSLDDPASWRAWDGSGFNLKFTNPYEQEQNGTNEQNCAIVSAFSLSYGLSYNTYFDKFIAVGHASGNVPVSGFYYILSDDLVNWSDAYLLMPAEFSYTSSQGPYLAYPTLVDHSSPSSSFDVTGRDVYLYFSRFNQRTFSDADILRVPVHFSIEK